MFEVDHKFRFEDMDAFMRTPEVYWAAVDALAPQPEEMNFVPHLTHPDVRTYACKFNNVIIGCVQFIRRTTIGSEIHVGFHPHKQFRGKVAKTCIEYAIVDVFEKTATRKLWAMIPSDNKPAIYLARLIGFTHEGRLTEAVVRNTTPPVRDLVILGLKRG